MTLYISNSSMTKEDKLRIAGEMFTQDSAELGMGVLDEMPGAYEVLALALRNKVDLKELIADAAGPVGALPARFNTSDPLLRAVWRTFCDILVKVVQKADNRNKVLEMVRDDHGVDESHDSSRNESTGPWYEQPLPL